MNSSVATLAVVALTLAGCQTTSGVSDAGRSALARDGFQPVQLPIEALRGDLANMQAFLCPSARCGSEILVAFAKADIGSPDGISAEFKLRNKLVTIKSSKAITDKLNISGCSVSNLATQNVSATFSLNFSCEWRGQNWRGKALAKIRGNVATVMMSASPNAGAAARYAQFSLMD